MKSRTGLSAMSMYALKNIGYNASFLRGLSGPPKNLAYDREGCGVLYAGEWRPRPTPPGRDSGKNDGNPMRYLYEGSARIGMAFADHRADATKEFTIGLVPLKFSIYSYKITFDGANYTPYYAQDTFTGLTNTKRVVDHRLQKMGFRLITRAMEAMM